MKKYLPVLAALLLLGCIATEKSLPTPTATPVALPRACFESGECVSLEIADTPQERAVGLMNRSFLPPGKGMLFVFEQEGRHAFWMKNTLIPLDILWLQKKGSGTPSKYEVLDLQLMPPCLREPCPLYEPKASSGYALEMVAGEAQKRGVKVGQEMSIELVSAS